MLASSAAAKLRVADLRRRFVIRPDKAPRNLPPSAAPEFARGPFPVIGAGVATGFEGDGVSVRPLIAPTSKKSAQKSATVELPTHANDSVRLEDDTSHMAVRFTLRGANQAEVKVTDGLALYAGALGGADVVHRPHAEGTEDFVVFETRPEREEIAYDIDVSHVAGLRLVSNTLEFLDGGGAPRLRMSPPYVVDARGDSHAATVAVEGCQYDTDPRAPWGRQITELGATMCAVRVSWTHVVYPAIVDPAWVATGSMATARAYHTATLLGTGKVLVAGGNNGSISLPSAELYDPSAGTFASTGSMANAREQHTATLLGTGKALLVGGAGPSPLSSAEIYDPAAGTFSSTGPMISPRLRHTATLLGTGKVLVAGGDNIDSWSTAEVYNPVAATFSSTGSMATARRLHTATLLSTGKVLVAGGFEFQSLSSAEVYDPVGGTFSSTGPMATARHRHTATSLGTGKVLVAGGIGAGSLSSAELYDPAAGTFVNTGSMTTERSSFTATLLGANEVLVAGGGASAMASSAELYDPATGVFTAASSLVTARNSHTATLLDTGSVLVVGGVKGNFLSSAELYDFAGSACAVADDCISGVCNNGVCCAVACAPGTCTQCAAGTGACVAVTDADDPDTCTGTNTCDAAGACKKKVGQACPNGNVDCANGICVDGFCCDQACNTPCVACAAALKTSGPDGICGNALTGTDPHNTCAADVAFPASCKADGMCDGNGACRQFALPTVACGPSMCANGSASGSFCNGGGTCLPSTMDCGPYACNAGACTTSCSSNADCADGAFCAPDQTCSKTKPKGATCAADAECDTSSCADGYCCNTSCTEQCAACDVTGKEGTCSPVSGPPHVGRPPCTSTGEACGGTCDGVSVMECNYPGDEKSCGTSACESGIESSSLCNGKGLCVAKPDKPCAPYTCGAEVCKTTCAVDTDCSGGNECEPDGTCAPKATGFTCVDEHTVVDADGNETACDPYLCVSGLCNKTCSSVDDCVGPSICDEAGHCVPPSGGGNTADPGCGCHTAGDSETNIGAWLAAIGLALAALRRRKQD